MKRRLTPKQKVANALLDLGFALNKDDFVITHGGPHKYLNDIIECWHIECLNSDYNRVSIYSQHTLTELARTGLVVVKNHPQSDLYGDLLAVPKK